MENQKIHVMKRKMPGIDPQFAALADGKFAEAHNPYLEEAYKAITAIYKK